MKTWVAVAAVVALVGFCLAAMYQGLRFWQRVLQAQSGRAASPDVVRTRLGDEHRRHLNNLREVEFDFETGKIDRDDYEVLKRRHEAGAIRAMRALDALAPEASRAAVAIEEDTL